MQSFQIDIRQSILNCVFHIGIAVCEIISQPAAYPYTADYLFKVGCADTQHHTFCPDFELLQQHLVFSAGTHYKIK
jgi:hypothetical protein